MYGYDCYIRFDNIWEVVGVIRNRFVKNYFLCMGVSYCFIIGKLLFF